MLESLYLYSGKGVNRMLLRHLSFQLKNFNRYKISSTKILKNQKKNNSSLFILGGGRDLPYLEKLKGTSNETIRKFVEDGGAFLGICAGAYYASSYVEFDKGYKREVLGYRDLCFFPGKAIGPAYGNDTFRYNSEFGARAALISCKPLNSTFRVYYNGGCYFEEEALTDNVEVIARYEEIENKPPAIIRCKVKKGVVLLSGVHFEYDPFLFFNSLDELFVFENQRRKFFNWVFEKAFLS